MLKSTLRAGNDRVRCAENMWKPTSSANGLQLEDPDNSGSLGVVVEIEDVELG